MAGGREVSKEKGTGPLRAESPRSEKGSSYAVNANRGGERGWEKGKGGGSVV